MPLEDCHVGISGLGLIGGSLGGALKASGKNLRVLGWDVNPRAREEALSRGLVDALAGSAEELGGASDILLLAVPPRYLEQASRDLVPPHHARLKAVFDVASVKGETGDILEALWGGLYVGLHPMAGKEVGGIDQAEPGLFVGKNCFLVPRNDSHPRAVALGEELIEALGARIVRAAPEEHDVKVAWGSHLPMLTAAALSLGAGRKSLEIPGIEAGMAGGFRDATRTASGAPWLGADVLRYNREALIEAAGEFVTLLEELLALSPSEAEKLFEEAGTWRRGFIHDL